MITSELRQKYLDFFEAREHKIVASASLLPENDPTTLFTGSGMQPMVPYLLGEKYPGGQKRIVNSQKCFRSGDIEEIGDNRHTTFFEMLGNWSLGDYFKKEQIEWMFEFLTKELELDPSRLYVSVYRGNEKYNLDKEVEAVEIWKEQFESIGIEAKAIDLIEEKKNGVNLQSKNLVEEARIFYYPDSENWWSRAGGPNKMPDGEPGGPDSEMFWDFGLDLGLHEKSQWKDEICHPACDCGRFVEIGNNVFMQYKKTNDGFTDLENKNIDFGGGLERLAMAVDDVPDVFLIDLFKLSREKIEELSGKKYIFTKGDLGYDEMPKYWMNDVSSMRIILDHLRAAVFLISDGANPSNKDQGYFTRRLIRRAVRSGHQLGIEENFTGEIAKTVVETYRNYYIDLVDNAEKIYQIINEEEGKFRKTLKKGLKEFNKVVSELWSNTYQPWNSTSTPWKNNNKVLPGDVVFKLFATYGFPIELTEEIAEEKGLKVDVKGFKKELKKHKDLSRTASVGKFKGGLVGDDEMTTQLHTVTHLMLAGLREVLGDSVIQKGSNITPERIRFDFSYDQALTDEQKIGVEKFVNNALQSGAKVELSEMSKNKARESGVIGAFWEKYPDQVKVYTITDGESVYSRELCGGPHVKALSEIKGVFKIKKEKSSGAGVRRIKAVVK